MSSVRDRLAAARTAAREDDRNGVQRDSRVSLGQNEAAGASTRPTAVNETTQRRNDAADVRDRLASAREQARKADSTAQTAGASTRPATGKQDNGKEEAGSVSFWQRVWNTAKGSAKSSAAGMTDASRALYESGQNARTARDTETMAEYNRSLERAKYDMRVMLEENAKAPGTWTDRDLQSQQNIIDDWQRKYDAMAKATGEQVQQKATTAAAQLADTVQESAQADIEKAKDGLGSVGRLAVDVGVAGTQMLGDAAANLIVPGGSLASMAYRGFGSGAQQARLNGATLAQQLGYGAASAGVEVLSEKIFDGLAGIYGGGAADDIVEGVIGKMAKTKNGQRALHVLASGSGEAAEEIISGAISPALESIYDGKNPMSHYSVETVTDILHDAAVGGILGGIGGAASVATGRYNPVDSAETTREATPEAAGARIAQQDTVDTEQAENAAGPSTEGNGQGTQTTTGDTLLDAIIKTMQPVTNRQAEAILNDPASASQLGIDTGGMTKSQQRAVVKWRVAQMQRDVPGEQIYDRGTDPLLQAIVGGISTGQNVENRNSFDSRSGAGYTENTENAGMGGEQNGTQLDGAAGEGVRAGTGAVNGRGYEVEGTERQGDLQHAGVVLVNSETDKSGAKIGEASDKAAFSKLLSEARDSDPEHGWSVTPKTEQELADCRIFMREDGSAGLAVKNNGDIEAVFRNQKGAKGAMRSLIPMAIRNGGAKLDCYGAGLVQLYEMFGFKPVCRVEFNPEYANPGWDPSKGTPYIYFMVATDTDADSVIENFGKYKTTNEDELNALPTFGKDGYDDADNYRNSLMESTIAPGTVGAAAAGFTQSDYGNLQLESSQFHGEGANAARPVDVPMYDGDGKPVSRFASNMMGAKAIPDDVIPLIQQMVADGELSYRARKNKNVRRQARASIREKGFDGAMEQLRTAVSDGKSDVDTVALGTELLVNAANAGDANAVAEIASLMQASSTRVGQAMQYFTVLRKLSPSAQLYAIEKTVGQLDDKVSKRSKKAGKTSGDAEDTLPKNVKIPQELMEKFLSQTDQEGRDAVMEEIYQNVADQVPPTWKDRWDAWRYMSMLANPRTHIRNIVGNMGFQPIRVVKNELAAGMERLFNVKEKTKSFASSPAMYRAAWADYDNVGRLISGNRYSDAKSEIERRRRSFDTKALEAVSKGNSKALDLEDAAFKRITYADALAGYLTANGVKAEQLDGGTVPAELLSRARDYAASEALKATYQDENAVSRKVQEFGRTLGVVGEAILPFKKTPANILARGFEYSPAGLAKALTYDLAKVQRGEMSAAQAIDSVASGLTGTGLFALGAYLFAQGLVTGAKGDDKEDKWDELLGHQGYALELPDGTSITLDWLAPEALPFFMGAEFMSSVGEAGWTGDEIVSAILDATKSVADPIIEMSMLQGVNDLIESVKYADGSPLSAMIPTIITSYLSQAVPTVMGQIERTSEPVRMTTYTDKNSKLPNDLQYAIGRVSARTPGIDYQQIPYIDAWGRAEESGDVMVRAVNNMFNPAYMSKVDVDNVESELQRLYDATGEGSVFPSRAEKSFTVDGEDKYLSAEEYVKYAKDLGQSSYQLVRDGMATSAYKTMRDTEKAEYISDLYSYAKASAKANAGGNALEGWQKNAKTAKRDIGVSTAEYIALYQKYGSGILSGSGYEKTKEAVGAGLTVDQYASMRNGLDRDGNGSVSQAEAKEKLDSMDFSREQKDQLWTIINKSWKKNPYAS